MKIKKLEIIGFKSFVDRTVVNFDHDVLGIVGPNGCGKSNIVDAMRWAMGEQSAKHLRGKSMEDVIFNGSESREPNEFAEVTLTFENNDPNDVPFEYRDYPELAVTRRLHRNGDSDYLINKVQVRLKDITDLFLGTGVGTKAYSIVEQGKIGLIVSAKPEDRRMLIEEAAGITKFKSKKKQAERKLEQTQQNLLRVGDIVAEIERNLGSLKRQAAKAERFVAYRSELEDVQIYEASHRYLEHRAWISMETAEVQRAEQESEALRVSMSDLDAALEAARLDARAAELELEVATAEHFAAESALQHEESGVVRATDKLATLRERELQAEREIAALTSQNHELLSERETLEREARELTELEANAEAVMALEDQKAQVCQATLTEAEATLAAQQSAQNALVARKVAALAQLAGCDRRREDLEDRIDRFRFEQDDIALQQSELAGSDVALAAQLDQLEQAKSEATARKADWDSELRTLKSELTQAEQALAAAKEQFHAKRSKLAALTEMHARMEGLGDGVKAVCRSGDPAVLGLLADRLEVQPSHSKALAAALGPLLAAVVVADADAAASIVLRLREQREGRATLLAQTRSHVAGLAALATELHTESGARLPQLTEFVRAGAVDSALMQDLLGDVWVARDDAEATNAVAQLRRADRHATQASCAYGRVVTLGGTLFTVAGQVEGGSGEDLAAAVLDSKREARELALQVEALTQQVAEQLAHFESARAKLGHVQSELEAARQDEHARDLALVSARKDHQSAAAQLTKLAAQVAQLARSRTELTARMANDAAEETQARVDVSEAEAAEGMAKGLLEEAAEYTRIARAELATQRDALTEHRVRVAGAREKLRATEGAALRLARSHEELELRRVRTLGELASGAELYGVTAAALVAHTGALADAQGRAQAAARALADVKAACELSRTSAADGESALKKRRSASDALRDELSRHERSLREHEMHLTHLLQSIEEKFRGLNLARVVGDYHMRPAPDESTRARIGELTQLINRMGTVNLEALREHAEAEERYAFYTTQKADLDKAIADLDKAIAQMNRESKRLFKETFDLVNEKFQIIFPKMFRGGRASLRLTNPEDMLETGIDILAQPPGKKLSSIELMSGGEKALTAVSLIFAIFQIKPSPFCILDEVDAPLDEANVARYNEMVREMTHSSQFILITHIKRTMQMVDVLYGVTMQESGVSKLVSVKLSEAAERTGDGTRRAERTLPEIAVA